MQFFQSVAICASALAAFAAAQSTKVAIYNMDDTVMVGKPVSLDINPGSGQYTLTLRRGNPNDLQNVTTITTTGSGPSFTWTPSSDLENGSDYAIMISQGDQSNYTPEFTITGGKKAGSSTSGGSSGAGSYGGAPAGGSSSSAAASTMSTAAKTASATNCAITQISDGQPQAPNGCPSSAPVASSAASAAPAMGSGLSNSTASASPVGAPYQPQAGATGAPAAPSSNSTAPVPTYNAPSSPSSGSSSSSSSGSQGGSSAAPNKNANGAAQLGSSFALIAGAAAAFAFLN